MIEKNKLHWWVPFRYQAEQAQREIPSVFSMGVLVRIVLVILGIFLLAAYLLPQRIPNLEFDWLGAFQKCMGALVLILAMCCALAFAPPMVMVTPKGIVVSQGHHSKLYPYADLCELRIEESGAVYPMLIFRTRSQREAKKFPVSPKISLDDLRVLIAKHKPK
jgi:hypothetical protein